VRTSSAIIIFGDIAGKEPCPVQSSFEYKKNSETVSNAE